MAAWDDDRLTGALGALRDSLEVDAPDDLDLSPPSDHADLHQRGHRRVLAAAAALVVVVAAVLAAVPDARQAVARWLGVGTVDVERRPGAPEPDGRGVFLEGVDPWSVERALVELGPVAERLDEAGLDRPTSAGRPPEGGIVMAWDGGRVTLWALRVTDAPMLEKQLGVDDDAEILEGIGTDVAVLLDGPHVLVSPVRTVAADRLVWWIDGEVQYRLEADRSRDDLVALVGALSGN